MKLDITIDTEDLKQQALKRAREMAAQIANRYLDQHFASGVYFPQKKGAGYLAIEQQIDDLICGPEIEAQTRRIVDEKFDAILEREIEYQITRRAKKLAAAAIKERESRA